MTSESPTNIEIRIIINGKDVRIKATNEASEDRRSDRCQKDGEHTSQSSSRYHGGGKRPPYFWPAGYDDDGINETPLPP